jgi:RimJ/RimL family protein N-acetyltransferase
MLNYKPFNEATPNYSIGKSNLSEGKTCYFIKDSGKVVHKSYLFSKVFLLKSIKKSGPVIGDCVTVKSHRGQSIYPYVINKIAKEVLEKDKKTVYIIVDKNNLSSIKGIEKAGFSKLASIVAKRWLWFYFKREIIYLNN